jgi:hypothetical protein
MLSIVDTWGRMQYFFKSCLAIVATGFCSVSLTRMRHESLTAGHDSLAAIVHIS